MADMLQTIFSPGGLSGAGGPRYLQLKRMIEEAVRSGAIRPGEALPAEREIAARTALSRVTVRKAVQDLVREGLLVQRHGSGTFVAPRVGRVEQSLSNLTSFTEDMASRGIAVRSVWLDRGIYAPVAGGVHRARPVLERARFAHRPAAHRRRRAPRHRAGRPSRRARCRILRVVDRSLYAALEKTGMRPVSAVQRISAALLGGRTPTFSACRQARRASTSNAPRTWPPARSSSSPDPSIAPTPTTSWPSFGCPARTTEGSLHERPTTPHSCAARSRKSPPPTAPAARRIGGCARRRRRDMLRDATRLFVTTVARGSSDHAATFLKYAVELSAGVPVASLGPSLASIYRRGCTLRQAACISISQSGRSPDIVAMAEDVRARRGGDAGADERRDLSAFGCLRPLRRPQGRRRKRASRRPRAS